MLSVIVKQKQQTWKAWYIFCVTEGVKNKIIDILSIQNQIENTL